LLGVLFDPEDGSVKFPPKRRAVSELHVIASQKFVLFIVTDVKTSDPTGSNGFASQG
jgi:hypothetical protein